MLLNESIVKKLINLQNKQDLLYITETLKTVPWGQEDVCTLEKEHIANVLQLFIKDEFAAEDIEFWANLIEGREDINYKQFNEVIFELANPSLTTKLTKARANAILKKLI